MRLASSSNLKGASKSALSSLYAKQFRKKHGEHYVNQITRTRQRIEEIDRQKRFVLHPNKNKWLGVWDMTSSFALLYTATLTPVETAFVASVYGPAAWSDGWFLINRLLDVVFTFDACLQFFVAYQQIDGKGNIKWITNHNQIIKHYIWSWFALDAFTIFVPLGFDLYSASPAMADAGGGVATTATCGGDLEAESATGNMSMLRVLRVLRLVKLVRLVRASRLYERWKTRITLSTGGQSMLSAAVLVLVTAHWYACVIALQASLQTNPLNSWLGPALYGFCEEPLDQGSTSNYDEWLEMQSQNDALLAASPISCCATTLTAYSWYLASLAWSIMVLTGTGGTDFYPSAKSDTETLIVMLLVLYAAFLWTYVLAVFCDVATNANPGLTHFNQQLDGLNEFIKTNELPKEMGRRLREYLHQMKGTQLQEYASRALPSLSPALQIEVVLHCHRHWLDAIWFLRGVEEVVLVKLAMSMGHRVLAPGEVAPLRALYVVSRGMILFGGRVLTRGMPWGDDVILHNDKHFSPYLARAMSYCDTQVLPRETLLSIVVNFPAADRQLRRAGCYLALRRYMIEEAKRRKALLVIADGTDLLEQMYDKSNLKNLSSTHNQAVNLALRLENVDEAPAGGSHRKGGGGGASSAAMDEMQKAIASLQADVLEQSRATQEQMRMLQASVEAIAQSVVK